jgi:DNA-binding transcriptional ArsR family regulator
MIGLHYAIAPTQSWPSFPAFISHLALENPVVLRKQVFNAYLQMRPHKGQEYIAPPDPSSEQPMQDIAPLLASVDVFLQFLTERFSAEKIDFEIESEAFSYLQNPPAMQSLIVSHLQEMWQGVLSAEWARVAPMLQASADAFHQLELGSLSKLEAASQILGQDLEEPWLKEQIEQTERLVFIPSAHIGPYLNKFKYQNTLWILFGARIPEGVHIHAPDLSRTEILVRINALADDNRLRILKLISEEGELRSQDIISRLELSQSAASRHLTQLSATGYLTERRCEGAKCYKLNPQRINDTLRAIAQYLLGE